jgi:hypothetical protein
LQNISAYSAAFKIFFDWISRIHDIPRKTNLNNGYFARSKGGSSVLEIAKTVFLSRR